MSMPTITSFQNPKIKQVMNLRTRKGRKDKGRFVVDGLREIKRANDSGLTISEIYTCSAHCSEADTRTLTEIAQKANLPLHPVTQEVYAKISYGDRQSNGIAVVETRYRNLNDFRPEKNCRVGVMERVEKPGNLGAVLRSADATQFSAIFLADPIIDLYNPNVIRSSTGAIFSVPVYLCKAEEAKAWLLREKFDIFAAHLKGAQEYTVPNYSDKTAIVLGNEAAGLTSVWEKEPVHPIRLPMLGTVDSLNVSVTAGVLFYEVLRQQRQNR
ncbi:MAG: hypothetical protein MPJ24_08340 [Pirellulaceae bacterium]|nr:hypothetical protein [Pirellulaceae bacterium]